MRVCSIDGCEKEIYHSNGFCRNHHLHLLKYGDPLASRPKTCLWCSGVFMSQTRNAEYCCDKCRFMGKVDMSDGNGPHGDCWLWTGTKHGKGYGHFKIGTFCEKAHRASFKLFCEHDPGNLLVCHRCDTPDCVNPQHLFLATNETNILDRQWKRRHAHGETHSRAIITEENVREIRLGDMSKIRFFAKKFNASESTIRQVGRGDTWRHLNDAIPPWGR